MTNQIAQTFGIETKEIEKTTKISSPVPATYDEFTQQLITHRKTDYIAVRDNLINLLKDMENVVDTVIDEVRSNPSARMVESFSTLVKTFSEVNKDLLSLTDNKTDSKQTIKNTSENDQNPVNNVIFIGTSDSLIDTIKNVNQNGNNII